MSVIEIPINPGMDLVSMVLDEIDHIGDFPSLSSQLAEILAWDDETAIETVMNWAAQIHALEVGHGFDFRTALYVATNFLVG